MTRLNRTQFSQQLIEFKTIAEDARSSNNPYVTPLFDLSEKYLRKWTSLPINCPLNTICSLKMQLLLEMGGILKESSQNGSSSSPITKTVESRVISSSMACLKASRISTICFPISFKIPLGQKPLLLGLLDQAMGFHLQIS